MHQFEQLVGYISKVMLGVWEGRPKFTWAEIKKEDLIVKVE